ncbi:MAG: N-formylglutamate amidohydrolase [Pseudomonadota bacterium]
MREKGPQDMENPGHSEQDFSVVTLINGDGKFPALLVCEHASNHIPECYNQLGISDEMAQSHAAWDPGALEIAEHLSQSFDAPLVKGEVSRLLYDCNRPPEAESAMVEKSEYDEIPGNKNLSDADRDRRVSRIYEPFRQCVEQAVSGLDALITIHSFTPVYFGKHRPVEVGILHDSDSRLADEMLDLAQKYTKLAVRRNEPYGPQDGVMHTLKLHGISNNILNVMIELRSDLIHTKQQRSNVADMLRDWLNEALTRLWQNSDLEVSSR